MNILYVDLKVGKQKRNQKTNYNRRIDFDIIYQNKSSHYHNQWVARFIQQNIKKQHQKHNQLIDLIPIYVYIPVQMCQ